MFTLTFLVFSFIEVRKEKRFIRKITIIDRSITVAALKSRRSVQNMYCISLFITYEQVKESICLVYSNREDVLRVCHGFRDEP